MWLHKFIIGIALHNNFSLCLIMPSYTVFHMFWFQRHFLLKILYTKLHLKDFFLGNWICISPVRLRVLSGISRIKLKQNQRVHANYASKFPRPPCHLPVLLQPLFTRSYLWPYMGSFYPANGGRQSTKLAHECQFSTWVESENGQQLHYSPFQGGLWKRVMRENPPDVQSLRWDIRLCILSINKVIQASNICGFKNSGKWLS